MYNLEFQIEYKINTNKSNRKFKNYNQVFFFTNSKFNLLYAEKKFRIYYKSTLEKKLITIQLNNQTELTYQFKYQSFKYERGKAEI